ncbi:MAG: aspartate--tRNA ligase [Eubacteriales bacterium]|jgi:aspartyl-tRNA synthetase|nr:aspartate--tRNA ligase [Eubacteriales bacterium]
MSELLGGWKRTNYCGNFTKADAGKEVILMGWANVRRDLGALVFVQMRDRTGLMQIVFNSNTLSEADFTRACTIRSEYVLAVRGKLVLRTGDMINQNMATGELEVLVSEFKILSESETTPFEISDNCKANELLRLKYRYLDLRRPAMQKNLIMRHKIAFIAREYFDAENFLEIETPILTKSTPEGARDYLVPSRVHPGKFFALPQSPQLFKQLLMLAGYDRYFQIARCFRDEDLRADRQPDFTQIDIEMSFVEEEDIRLVNERFLQRLFKDTLNVDIQLPLPRLKYEEAMARYGSDKPDTRFGLELVDLSDVFKNSEFSVFQNALASGGSIRAVNAKGASEHFSRKELDAMGEFVKTYRAKGLIWMNDKADGLASPVLKFLTEDEVAAVRKLANFEQGDVLFLVADVNDIVFASLGALRMKLAEKLNLIAKDQYHLLWVTEFPLLEWDEEAQRFSAKHHPFTSPMDEDLANLDTDPGSVRAKAYDIVLNGVEIGGGSIRIHSRELQKKMFRALGFTDEQAEYRFGFLMDAFRFGPPPHGGMAYGLDRLAMIITGSTSIRDVIAFPKVQNASCPMTGAPDFVDDKQLRELSIACVKAEE